MFWIDRRFFHPIYLWFGKKGVTPNYGITQSFALTGLGVSGNITLGVKLGFGTTSVDIGGKAGAARSQVSFAVAPNPS
jgi:hypothetical protein